MIEVLSLDSGETIYADTQAEAIAIAAADLGPGGEITVHDADCKCDEVGNDCTCEPQLLVVGEANEG